MLFRSGLALVQPHKARDPTGLPELERGKALSAVLLEDAEGVDVGECDLSIEKLNETISTLQQAILRISQQQEQLLLKSPTVPSPGPRNGSQDPKAKAAIHFGEPPSPTALTSHRKPPRLGQGRNARSGRPAELKVPKERQQGPSRSKTPTPGVEATPHLRSFPPRTPPEPGWDGLGEPGSEAAEKCVFDSYRLHDESNQRMLALSSSRDANVLSEQGGFREGLEGSVKEAALSTLTVPGKENVPLDEPPRSKASLIEVDLSDLKAPDEDGETEGRDSSVDLGSEGDQKLGVGFFFKVRGAAPTARGGRAPMPRGGRAATHLVLRGHCCRGCGYWGRNACGLLAAQRSQCSWPRASRAAPRARNRSCVWLSCVSRCFSHDGFRTM